MLIDKILDRMAGWEYEGARELYDYCMSFSGGRSGSPYTDVARALDSGTEEDVKKAINTRYLVGEYDCQEWRDYVNSVDWLVDERGRKVA